MKIRRPAVRAVAAALFALLALAAVPGLAATATQDDSLAAKGNCGCAAGDLMCAMKCSARADVEAAASPGRGCNCQPGDPLCSCL